MLPLRLLSRLVPQPHPGPLPQRTLTTTQGLLKQCGDGGKRRDAKDLCQESRPCKGKPKKKAKNCNQLKQDEEGEGGGEVPEMCSKQAALDCARKLEDLQKQWERVARAVERAEAAQQLGAGAKRASGCPVKPPPKPEKEGSSMPVVLGLMAVIGGVAYYLYTQSQEGEGGKGDDDKKEG